MIKMAKIIKLLLLTISISITILLNTVFAFDLTESENIEIQEQFQYFTNSLKNGDFETVSKYITIKDPISDTIDNVSKYVPYSDIAKDIISKIDGNDLEYIKAYFTEIFKNYNFTLKRIEKVDIDKCAIVVELQIPAEDYYAEVDELLKDKEKLEKGIGLADALFFNQGLMGSFIKYMFKGRTVGKLLSSQYYVAFSKLNETNYDTKQIERTVYIDKVNGRYMWQIDFSNHYDWLQGKYEYNGNNSDDRNLMQYLFIPLWTLIQDYYKS